MELEQLLEGAGCEHPITEDGVVPVCSRCKRVRDGRGIWQNVGDAVDELPFGAVTHGLCEQCAKILYGEEITAYIFSSS